VERTAEPVVEGNSAALSLIDGSGVLPSRGLYRETGPTFGDRAPKGA